MNTKSNTYPGQCSNCGATVETGIGTVSKNFDEWVISHLDCTPTALTVPQVAALFPSLTPRQLDTILDVNLTEDEIDDNTGIINQAGVNTIGRVVTNNTAYQARMDAQSAKVLAAYRATDEGRLAQS